MSQGLAAISFLREVQPLKVGKEVACDTVISNGTPITSGASRASKSGNHRFEHHLLLKIMMHLHFAVPSHDAALQAECIMLVIRSEETFTILPA